MQRFDSLVAKAALAAALAGAASVTYAFASENGTNGHFLIGTFVAIVGLVTAMVHHARARVLGLVAANPLFHWKFPAPGQGGAGDFPSEILVSAEGMVWDGQIYPFGAINCSLVEFRVDEDPVPRLTVVCAGRGRHGRKRYRLSVPIPAGRVGEAEGAVGILVEKYRLQWHGDYHQPKAAG